MMLNVPPLLLLCTDPVLLKATPIVEVAVPALFLNVPPLLTAPAGAVLCVKLVSFCRSTVDPDGLLNTAPTWKNSVLKAPGNVAVPLLTSVRAFMILEPLGKLIPPLALSVELPLSVPTDQVKTPLTLIVSVPVRVPAEKLNELVLIVPPLEKFNVPPDTVSGPTLVITAVASKFAVPELAVVPPVTL